MRSKSFALLALALGCGLVASIGITQVLATRTSDSPALAGETETIFVALKEVPMGDTLNPQSFRLEPWPKDKVPVGAITKLENIDGRRSRAKLYPGEPILEDKLFRKGEGNDISSMIPKGYRVVAVKATTETAGGNLLNPGDRVDVMVYLTRNPQNDILTTGTRMVLENIKVFAVNDVVNSGTEKDGKSIKAATVSLLVTPEQAARVTLAAELGTIRLALRSPDEEPNSGMVNITPGDLFGVAKGGDAGKETLVPEDQLKGKAGNNLLDIMKAAASRAAADKTGVPGDAKPTTPDIQAIINPMWNVRILKPGAVDDVTLEMEQATEVAGQSTGAPRWRNSHGAAAAPAAPGPLNSAIEQIKEAKKADAGDNEPAPEPKKSKD